MTLTITTVASAQIEGPKFGKGITIVGKDSSYSLNASFRFQNLVTNSWRMEDDEFSSLTDHTSAMMIRRSRFKFKGFAFSPKLTFKFEMGLSNRDVGGGSGPEFNRTSNLILDAYLDWNFYKNFIIRFGQGKLPGNRERVISSANLQFVDRSRLNSRFNIDRDFGFFLKHSFKIGEVIFKETVVFSQGEGRNVTGGHFGGYAYTAHLEIYPFGAFQSKGDYVGSAIKYESQPKLALAAAYHFNDNAPRQRGQLGSFNTDNGEYNVGQDLTSIFVDMMFKYRRLSIMAEYASRSADNAFIFDLDDELIGTYYLGSSVNFQIGYMLPKYWEVAARYTTINPDEGVDNDENQYTLGLSKFFVGHKLKVQTDVTWRERVDSDDQFIWRLQCDIHF